MLFGGNFWLCAVGEHDREYRARARIVSGIESGARDAGNTPNSHTVCSTVPFRPTVHGV